MRLLLALCCLCAWAQDPLNNPGFQHFYNLEYDEALAAFAAQAAKDPASPDSYNHIAQTILFRQMFRSGALESDLIAADSFLRRPKLPLNVYDQKRFSDAVNRAIALSEARLKRDPNDVAALYSIGVSYGARANYYFLVRKAWIDALSDTAAARKMHTRVIELDPNFIDARLILGVHEYVVGCLPWGWRMLGSVTGFSGDRDHGIQTLQLVADKGLANRYDAAALLTAIYRREKRSREAIPLLTDLIPRFPRAYLLRLELADMYGDAGDRTSALAQLDEVGRLKRSNAPGFQRVPQAKIQYTRGNLLLTFNDMDRALEEIKAATDSSGDLDPATAAYAWLRLGQIYDLKSQRPQAIAAYRETVRRSPDSDAAGSAKGFISSRYKR